MQKFKLVAEEVAESMKKLKKNRNEDIREIKQLYQDLEQKQKSPFEQTVDRIIKNLSFFKESEYKAAHAGINSTEIVRRYEGKLMKIND
jgi:hypothetical protein